MASKSEYERVIAEQRVMLDSAQLFIQKVAESPRKKSVPLEAQELLKSWWTPRVSDEA